MATKRMLARTIIECGEFEDLSVIAQMLYVRLNLVADDDGFAESGIPMVMLNATNETLDELVNAGFIIKVPNRKRLYHIRGWRVHNTIEASKYTASIYKPMLRILYPDDIDYIMALPAFERPKNYKGKSVSLTFSLPNSLPNSLPQYSVDKDSVDKVNVNKCSVNVYIDDDGNKYELEPTDDIPMPDDSDCPPEHYDGSYCYDEYENNDNNTTEIVEQENDNTHDEIDLLLDENGELKDRKSMYIITADGRHILNHAVFERMAQIRKQREQEQEPNTQQEDDYWKPNPNRPSKDKVRNYMIQTAKDLGKDINMVDIEQELKRFYETNDRRSTWNTADWQFWVKRWVENERFGSSYIQSGGDIRLLNSKFVS